MVSRHRQHQRETYTEPIANNVPPASRCDCSPRSTRCVNGDSYRNARRVLSVHRAIDRKAATRTRGEALRRSEAHVDGHSAHDGHKRKAATFTCVDCGAEATARCFFHTSWFDFVRSMRSGRKRAALRTARRRGKPHLREGVHRAGQVRDLAWTRPCDAGPPARQPRWGAGAVSRLTRATRRSPRSLTSTFPASLMPI
jgi:hypothetical protein